jgi:hypothetical protein
MRLAQLFFVSAACVALMTQPAAADVMDGVTFEELEAALTVGLDVQTGTTSKGNKFLMAKGKNHIIAAQLLHCGGGTRCNGVRYFSILATAPSATTINEFNYGPNYSKVALNSGKAVISLDHYAGGGVTSENLLRTAAMLMAGMTGLGATADIISSNKPATTTVMLSFDGAPQREGLFKAPSSGPVTFAVDPALGQAIMQQVDATR